MNRLMIPAAFLALAACGQPAQPEAPATAPASPMIAIADAICRPTPNGRNVTGCYLTLTADQDDRLVSISAPLAGAAEIHEMKTEDGIMKMAELKDGLALPAGEPVRLQPGGNHLMLMGLSQPLVVGEQVSITLNFERAQPVGIRATVAQPPVS